MEKDMKVRGKIKGALFYPSFILVAMVGVAILMLTQVIPQLKDVFESSGKSLPPQTQFLLSLSGLVLHKGYLLAAGAIVIGLAGRWFLKTEMGIQFISFASLKLPIIANIIEETSMARFGRLLGMLLSSGVPLIEALRMINESFTNRLYQRGVANVISQVERGTPMSTPISNDKIFPLMVGQMVAVGEQTGKMDEVMVRMADYYESEVDTKVAGISSLIEPIVIVIMGVGVAWLVIAILLPVYQISSNP
jgi:type IV pilus assembly protein PilC